MAEEITAANCPAKCLEKPDAVEKINWKCIECGTHLKQAFDALMDARQKEAEEKLKREAKQAATDELTVEEKNKRRRFA